MYQNLPPDPLPIAPGGPTELGGAACRAAPLARTGGPEPIDPRRIVTARIVPPPTPSSPWIERTRRRSNASALLRRDGRIRREESFDDTLALAMPTGLEYLVTLRRDDCWYARRRVRHDGSEHVLVLSPLARIRAHLVDAGGRAIAGGRAAIDFAAVPGAPRSAAHWNTTKAGMSDASGELIVILPGPLKLVDSERLEAAELPRRCPVPFEASGHARREVESDLDPGVTRDFGDVLEEGQELGPPRTLPWPAPGSTLRLMR